jgi:mono/diheme cytochrome c family protein
MRILSTTILAFAAIPAFAAVEAQLTKEQTEFFETKVRPILAENCYKCHSVEQGKAKGGLTLDTRPGWQKGGENGQVIQPGHVDASPLIQAVRYKDPDLQMPPKGEKLSAEQIATLEKWVEMGAPDPRAGDKESVAKMSGLTDAARNHWAYQPVKKPAVPETKTPAWCKTPIDAFVLQKLEANKMVPNKPATKEALIRRAYFDLVGLPPTPYEVADFIKDQSPEAFAKVVDKLLAMPQYGERWGRHWLDTARYSDTIGGERNNNRTIDYRYPNAWTYRDYVVKSFNTDKPYDQFVMEQLAVDKLPGVKEGDPRLAALGFLTVGERFRNPNDIINDRIDTVSKGFLGLTVACARCHDHKFDPIPTKDYYALHGIFNSIFEPTQEPTVVPAAKPTMTADFQQKFGAEMKEMQNRYFDAVGDYLTDFWKKPEAYLKAAVATAGKGKGAGAEGMRERNALIRDNKLDDQFLNYLSRGLMRNVTVWGPLYEIKREGKFDVADLDKMGSEMADRMARKGTEGGKGKYAMTGEAMEKMMKEQLSHGPNKLVVAALKKTPPKNLDEAIKIYADLLRSVQPQAKTFIATMKNASSAQVNFDDDLADLLRGPFTVEAAPMMTKDIIEANYLSWLPRMQGKSRLNFGELNLLETSHPGAPGKAMVVNDKPNPKDSPIFIRGESQSRGPIAPRAFLEILSPERQPTPFTQGSGRLDLAKAIASKDNPLTARVAINRLWMYHFGDGFISTPDDLGVQCGQPTHPELLDYLASKFVESGWSMKTMHKLIMLSAVYQQSVDTNKDYENRDPENHMLWRANIRRLDFEAMRDSLLVFSGQLDKTLGGKPINLTDEPYSYRRSVYGYIDRGNLPELMQNFDFSDPDMPNSKRTTTVVPQQALFLMNSSMAVDISRKLVARPEIQKTSSNDEKVRWLYRIIYQRLPTDTELGFARNFLNQVQGSSTDTVATTAASTSAPAKSEALNAKANKDMSKRKSAGKFGAIQNEGQLVDRRPQSALEAYAQALLFSNEVAYVN